MFFFLRERINLGKSNADSGIRFLVAANVLLMANDLRKKWKRFIISKLQIELEYRVSVGFGKIRNSHCAIDCKLNFLVTTLFVNWLDIKPVWGQLASRSIPLYVVSFHKFKKQWRTRSQRIKLVIRKYMYILCKLFTDNEWRYILVFHVCSLI